MRKMSLLEKIRRTINNYTRRKERFLYCCAFRFYLKVFRESFQQNGKANLLPFIEKQLKKDYAHQKATEFVQMCIREKIVNQRYKLALEWAKNN